MLIHQYLIKMQSKSVFSRRVTWWIIFCHLFLARSVWSTISIFSVWCFGCSRKHEHNKDEKSSEPLEDLVGKRERKRESEENPSYALVHIITCDYFKCDMRLWLQLLLQSPCQRWQTVLFSKPFHKPENVKTTCGAHLHTDVSSNWDSSWA